MNAKLLIALIVLLIFSSSVIYASPAPPSPICEIDAEILKIGEALDDVDIKITTVNKMIDEGYQPDYKDFNCQEYENRQINDTSIRTEGNYKFGQIIKAEISYFADEFSQGYVLDNVIILTEPEDNSKDINILYYLIPIIIIILLIFILKGTKKKH